MAMRRKRYTVAVDFDGVLHRYDTPWIAPHVIPDEPVEGAIEWLCGTLQRFDVVILSTRCQTWRGRVAVRRWLAKHAGNLWCDDPAGGIGLAAIRLHGKPPALVYIDDRAWRFTGDNLPTAQEIHQAKPWHKTKDVREGETDGLG